VEKVCVIPTKKLAAFIEEGTLTIHFLDMSQHPTTVPVEVGTIHTDTIILAMVYIPEHQGHSLFVTAHADLVMRAWNLDEGPLSSRWQVKASWPVKSSVQSICWSPSHRLIFSGGINGEVKRCSQIIIIVWTIIRAEGATGIIVF